MRCHFEHAPSSLTCATTGALRIKGRTYDSLLDYYQQAFPELRIDGASPAVYVSFERLDRPQPVAASLVHVRVANDDVPEKLSTMDKIAPGQRRAMIQHFWGLIGDRPLGPVAPGFGPVAPGVERAFWRPDAAHTLQFRLPAVEFGQGKQLQAPSALSRRSYQIHYRQRVDLLDQAGCYSVPPGMTRTLYYAFPVGRAELAVHRVAADVVERLSRWTGQRLEAMAQS